MVGKWLVATSVTMAIVGFVEVGSIFAQGNSQKSTATPAPENGPAAKRYTVWVYKLAGREWQKQADRTFETDDETQARRYVESVKAVSGWTATSNLPVNNMGGSSIQPIGSIEGTTWKADRTGYIRFAPGGVLLQSTTGADFFAKGSWAVCDCVIVLQIDASPMRYPGGIVPAQYTGYLNGNRIYGNWIAYNRPNNCWSSMYVRVDKK